LYQTSLGIFYIYFYTKKPETHQYVEITAPSFPAALTSVGSQLQRIRRQAFVSSRNWKRRGEEGVRGLLQKYRISRDRAFFQKGNISWSELPLKEELSQAFLPEDNFSQKRNTSGLGVLFMRTMIQVQVEYV
jgi:hypothetical protein